MADQHDFDIANATHAAFRADLNSALLAAVKKSNGATQPATRHAYQDWADTTSGTLKRRNAANNAWLTRDTLAETFVLSRSSNTILAETDFGRTIIATSTFTQTFTAAATLADGWYCHYRNNGTGVITLDPNSSELIDGVATVDLAPGASCAIWCNGTAFFLICRTGDSPRRQVFTSSGTWTKPAGLKRIKVTVVGGGGGGGGTSATSAAQVSFGGGGGGGGTSIKTIEASSLAATEAVTVGTGGPGGNDSSGTVGVTSSFNTHCSATGGAGGLTSGATAGAVAAGGPGGIGSGGDLNIRGGPGTDGFGIFNTNAAVPFVKSGEGGSSHLGGGADSTARNLTGTAGGPYGGGGSGACAQASQAAFAAGAGATGIVIVEEFF